MKNFTFILFSLLFTGVSTAQDGLNQVIVVNGGQFGNPNERANLAAFDPVGMTYNVFDTIPVNSVQDILIEGDYAFVAAQDFILKYDLDSYELLAQVDFPGVSAHQLEIAGDYLFATNYFSQTQDNLYVFDKEDLAIVDTVEEISHPGGTMAVLGSKLYLSQNLKGNIDQCAPFGCLNDTMGYVSVVDVNTLQWLEDIQLDNNGNEAGRIFATGNSLVMLNEVSNTSTALLPATGQSFTVPVSNTISTIRYRTEGIVLGGQVISLFDGGIGLLSDSLNSADILVDTPVTSFAYDLVNDQFFITSTDFFSYNNGYVYSSDGTYQYDFPVGFAPEAIGVHYNRQPVGNDFEAESMDTVLIDVNAISSDPDGDVVVTSRVENAPVNGVVNILEDGSILYVSLSPGSADAFRIEVCDVKLNPLCSFINVTILPVSAVSNSVFESSGVFPNPVRDHIRISNPVDGADIELFNAQGISLTVTKDHYIDMRDYPAGMYFIRMRDASNADDSKVFPILKQ